MNDDDYWDDDRLPAVHLRDCGQRRAVDLTASSASMCAEDTCQIPARIDAQVVCPHYAAGAYHEIEADTFGELIDRITAFGRTA